MTASLEAGRPAARKRAMFGLLDADGWSWASVKAFIWLIVLIVMLGYIPDRAYYIMVNRTLELGIIAWSPVNLCPPENRLDVCPVPAGAVLPWEQSPAEVALPAARTGGAAVQVGKSVLYIGGTDGAAPSATVFHSKFGEGTFGAWAEGPPLPVGLSDFATAVVGTSVFVMGGRDADGVLQSSTFLLTPDPETGELGSWKTATEAELTLDLPKANAGASAVAVGDGLLLIGGETPDGLTGVTWKSTFDKDGILGPWVEQVGVLGTPVADAVAGQAGDYIWVYGGRGANGPVGTVQRGTFRSDAKLDSHGVPEKGADTALKLLGWAVAGGPVDLPAARTDAGGFAANGSLYLIGGSDGAGLQSELYWTVPTATGEITEWRHLDQIDLPGGLAGAAPLVSGPNAFLIGGTADSGILSSATRASLAPQAPFFRVGLVGAEIPALRIEGEIGQQIGYLSAAGAGTLNFVILLLIGWAFAHKERTREIFENLRRRRRR